MIKLTKQTEQAILSHAKAAAPNECCGLVVMQGRKQVYLECDNVSDKPVDTFEIDVSDWLAADDLGKVVAVVHSHPENEPHLSGADRQMQVKGGLPWLLVTGGRIKQYRPCPHLRGRVFDYGRADCGVLVRDAYMLAGIDLPDHERTEIDADADAGYLQRHIEACGFVREYDGAMKPGDVVLTAFGGNANHAALYLGDGEILHHAYDTLSRREPYGAFWRQRTHSVWRHKNWQPDMIRAVFNDLQHAVEL